MKPLNLKEKLVLGAIAVVVAVQPALAGGINLSRYYEGVNLLQEKYNTAVEKRDTPGACLAIGHLQDHLEAHEGLYYVPESYEGVRMEYKKLRGEVGRAAQKCAKAGVPVAK